MHVRRGRAGARVGAPAPAQASRANLQTPRADTFVELAPGHYKLKYKRSPPHFSPARCAVAAAEAAAVGAFAALPTDGDFSDDAYWAAIARAAGSGHTVTYPSDIHASVLRDLPGMPVGWCVRVGVFARVRARARVPRALI